MGDTGEHEQPAVYLKAFYGVVRAAVSALSVTPTDSSLIEAIMTTKDTDNELLTYVTALFAHQPILALVGAIQVMLMIGSFVGGFFFVLARMVGAFGGRKVQNITTQYMHILQFYSVFMVLFLALNAIAIFCLWGSTNHFAVAVEKSEKIVQPGVNEVQRYVVGTVQELRKTLNELRTQRSDMFSLIKTGNQDYRKNIKFHADRVLSDCGLPTPAQLSSLKEFLDSVKSECSADATCTQNVDEAEAARLKILNITKTISTDFEEKFNSSVQTFLMLSPIQTEFNEIDRNDVGRIKKIVSLESAVMATRYPTVTSISILGSLSPYDMVFTRGEEYGKAAATVAIMLETVAVIAFVVGIVNHSQEVPPNKRSFVSNQSGIALVVSSLFMWLFCTVMAPSSLLFMIGGVISQQYICEPYSAGQLLFIDEVVLTMFVPNRDDDTNAEYNVKTLELYNTTMKPSIVLSQLVRPQCRSCSKNATLLATTGMSDIKTLETALIVANPPKYLLRLINRTAFSAVGYSEDWKGLIGTDLEDLATPVEKLSDSQSAVSQTGPINDIASAKAHVAKWREAAKKLYDCWAVMELTISNEMNANHYSFIMGRIGSRLEAIQELTHHFYEIVGSCLRVATIYKRCFEVFCYAIVANLNGVWCALLLVCFFFSASISVILKLSRYLMRMDDYMYEGMEVEESIASPADDKTSGLSVSYAPSAGVNLPPGQYKWRRPKFDFEGRFQKFESNPYQKPDLEELIGAEMDESEIDFVRWQHDRLRDFVPEALDVELKRVKDMRQRLGIPANQPLPIGGSVPMPMRHRGPAPRGLGPRGPGPRAPAPRGSPGAATGGAQPQPPRPPPPPNAS